jgi:hypothetical protein
MLQNKYANRQFYAYSEGQKVNLDVTLSDAVDTTGTAILDPVAGAIIVDFTSNAANDTVTITTPFAFKVRDVTTICTAAVATATMQVLNTTTAITDAMACAVDKAVVRMTTHDDAAYAFAEGDDDLVVKAGTAAADGLVYIYIESA